MLSSGAGAGAGGFRSGTFAGQDAVGSMAPAEDLFKFSSHPFGGGVSVSGEAKSQPVFSIKQNKKGKWEDYTGTPLFLAAPATMEAARERVAPSRDAGRPVLQVEVRVPQRVVSPNRVIVPAPRGYKLATLSVFGVIGVTTFNPRQLGVLRDPISGGYVVEITSVMSTWPTSVTYRATYERITRFGKGLKGKVVLSDEQKGRVIQYLESNRLAAISRALGKMRRVTLRDLSRAIADNSQYVNVDHMGVQGGT